MLGSLWRRRGLPEVKEVAKWPRNSLGRVEGLDLADFALRARLGLGEHGDYVVGALRRLLGREGDKGGGLSVEHLG